MRENPIGLSQVMFAAWNSKSNRWQHFYTNKMAYSLTGSKEDSIHQVKVIVDDDGEYFGWWYSNQSSHFPNTISMIFHSIKLVEICFAGGTKIEEEAGMGRVVKLRVEKL